MSIAAPGISYEKIATLTASELSALIAAGLPAFNTPEKQPLSLPELTRGATLYRVIYSTVVDQSGKSGPQHVSGLLMVPEATSSAKAAEEIPLLIYNHGTLFNREQSPTNVVYKKDGGWGVGSFETLFNLGLAASKGYALIAADYVGYGINTAAEGYGVKQPSTTATIDFVATSRSVFSELGVRPQQLFMSGWSQGGLNTQWVLQGLEALGIPVAAAAAQSPFNEMEQTFRWWVSQKMSIPKEAFDPAPYLSLCVALLVKSYESWFGLEGLTDDLIKDEIIPESKDSEGNVVRNPEGVTYREVIENFGKYGDSAVTFDPPDFSNFIWKVQVFRNGKAISTTIPGFAGEDMLVKGVLDQPTGVVREFLQQLRADSPRYWTYKTPFKAWYGMQDEALPPELVAPDMALQGGPEVTLIPVKAASHRQTFLNAYLASPQSPAGTNENLIDWFQSFRKNGPAVPNLMLIENSLNVQSEDYGLLPVQIEVNQLLGERAMHVEILRTRLDGRSEVIGSIGGTSATANQLQSLGTEKLLLQVGDKLDFQLLSRRGDTIDSSSTEIRPRENGKGFDVILREGDGLQGARLQFGVVMDPLAVTPTPLDRIAAVQGVASAGLLQLRQGQRLGLTVTTDCALNNRVGFVKLNRDPVTGLPLNTVGNQQIVVQSAQFEEQIDSLLIPDFQFSQSGRKVTSGLEWNVSEDGIYAAVLATPLGQVFCGVAGDGSGAQSQQMRLLGQNKFGFEDLVGSVSDYDWNDLVLKIDSVA